jgi:hypothetical protein
VAPQGHHSGVGDPPVVVDKPIPAGTVIRTIEADHGLYLRVRDDLQRHPGDRITGTLEYYGPEISPYVPRKLNKVEVKLVLNPNNPSQLHVVLLKKFTFDKDGAIHANIIHPELKAPPSGFGGNFNGIGGGIFGIGGGIGGGIFGIGG